MCVLVSETLEALFPASLQATMANEQPQQAPTEADEPHPSLPQGQVHDETGRVICKFPPFPIPPAGVRVLSFEEFAPSGIQIRFGEEVERDCVGVPTIRLEKQHDNESVSRKKRKTTRTMVTGEVIDRTSTWWEDWEAGEPQRIRSARKFDS